jgi:tetratricopeptide (TPR) repeat protein
LSTFDTGTRTSQGYALVIVGETHRALGRYDDALEYLDQALAIACDTGARTNQCLALKTIGDVYRALDRHDEASQYLEHALTIARECGDRGAEARGLNSLGGIARSGGAPAKALDQYQEALTIAEETGGRYDQACAHLGLGDAYHDLDGDHEARSHWERALVLYTGMCVPEAADARARLEDAPDMSVKASFAASDPHPPPTATLNGDAARR